MNIGKGKRTGEFFFVILETLSIKYTHKLIGFLFQRHCLNRIACFWLDVFFCNKLYWRKVRVAFKYWQQKKSSEIFSINTFFLFVGQSIQPQSFALVLSTRTTSDSSSQSSMRWRNYKLFCFVLQSSEQTVQFETSFRTVFSSYPS